MSDPKPLTPEELYRLRESVDGPASCGSCGRMDVPPEQDLCPCDDAVDGVVVEPITHEFTDGTLFADRNTVRRLLSMIATTPWGTQ